MDDRVLRLNIAGQPQEWLHWQQAACLYARGVVCWEMGGKVRRLLGGRSQASGRRSRIDLPSIIACAGRIVPQYGPALSNSALFARDNSQCLYCGQYFSRASLSRDHVHPVSRGGENCWENVVAACLQCNQKKGDTLLEHSDMQLLALPFRPNPAEYLALINSARIRADQMEFLRMKFSSRMRWN